MADISLSKAVRANLLSLKGTADMMSMTQNRLATGNKVNSALDNPSNWFTAKGLTNRASDLGALIDSMANGIQTLEAADNGLSAMTKTLESMQSTLRQARQDKSFQTASFSVGSALNDQATVQTMSFKGGSVGDLARSIEVTNSRAVTTATTDFANLVMDSDNTAGFTAAAATTFTIAANDDTPTSVSMVATSATNVRVTIGSNTYDTTVASTEAVTKENVAAALNKAFAEEKVGITVDATAAKLKFSVNADKAVANDDAKITFGADNAALGIVAATDTKSILTVAKSVDDLVDEVNTNTDLKAFIRASNDNGKLRIENQSTQKLNITGASAGNITGAALATSEVEGNSVRAGLAGQFNELRDQLDKLADDASFNGINLLRGDKLTITFNETGTSAIDIQTKNAKTVNAKNLDVPTNLEEKQLDSDVTIDGLLTDLKAALDEVRSQASTFGSNLSIVQNRKSFTEAMINTLETGAGNLTLADMNTEAANLLALQTRQQLSQNSLSLASQADQSILQLLQ
ncbi:flagellin [Devosia sp. Naph2]|uniref:flagellin N-terminal helical domain-containing protein n=1 Tax=Devosia polycyclovorans TaxID=3345148 RepID=UPI0035D08760